MMGDLSNTIIDGDPFDINEGGGGGSGAPFTGATALTDGTQGDVPKPLAGQQNATLFGDGSWKTLLYDALSRYENAVTGRSYTYSGDLNNITQNCIVNTDGSNANRPSGTSNWGFVVTLMHSNTANYATQIYVTMNEADASKNMFFRDKANGTWQSWKRLLTENDLTSINTAIGNKQDKLTNPLTQSDVVNNLTSTSTFYPLSAAQGKALKGSIDTLNTKAPKLLWTNPNSYFNSGQISLPQNNYDYYLIRVSGIWTFILKVGQAREYSYSSPNTTLGDNNGRNGTYGRKITESSHNSITFTTGYYAFPGTTWATANNVAVPNEIIGFNTF